MSGSGPSPGGVSPAVGREVGFVVQASVRPFALANERAALGPGRTPPEYRSDRRRFRRTEWARGLGPWRRTPTRRSALRTALRPRSIARRRWGSGFLAEDSGGAGPSGLTTPLESVRLSSPPLSTYRRRSFFGRRPGSNGWRFEQTAPPAKATTRAGLSRPLESAGDLADL